MKTHTPGEMRVGTPTEHGTFHANTLFIGDQSIAVVYGIPQNCKREDAEADNRWGEGLANADRLARGWNALAARPAASSLPEVRDAAERLRDWLNGHFKYQDDSDPAGRKADDIWILVNNALAARPAADDDAEAVTDQVSRDS